MNFLHTNQVGRHVAGLDRETFGGDALRRDAVGGAIMPPLMTYQQTANNFRISLATIGRMVRAGEILGER